VRRCAVTVFGIAISAIFLAAWQAYAQSPPNQPLESNVQPAANNPGGSPTVEASPLETFLLRDSKGNLVPVLDLPFEEFERLLRIKRGLAPPAPPGFTLDKLTATGTAESNRADLEITLSIRSREAGLLRVPLGLEKSILRQPAKQAGPGELFITFDAADGYVLWLRGEGKESHVVTIEVSVPITPAGSESRLALALPRATESSLRLRVPAPHAEARVAAGEGIVSSKDEGGGHSELTVLGPSGRLELAWQAGREPTESHPAAMESSGEILVKVEGVNRISSDAKLRVRNTNGAIATFRVRLPKGMELVPTDSVGYSVSVIDAAASTGRGQAAAQTVEVAFARPQTGIVEVRLLVEQGASFASGPLQPGHFEVVGAVRQRGTIDFSVDGDWQLSWKEDNSVRRLDLPADASAAKLAARYEYSRQPCGLELTVATRPSRIGVEPVHVVYVDDKQLRLETTLKYRLRGARAAALQFELGRWQLDRLSPGELFEISPPDPTSQGPRLVSFRSGVAVPQELEVKLEAHLPLDPESGEVQFELPRPLCDSVAPATVMIVPADNVELTPQNARITGLALDPAPPAVRFPARQQPPLVYRDLATEEPALFAADVRVRTRWSTASGRAKVQLDAHEMHVEQRLDYRIDYESRRTFDLLIPRSVLIGRPLQVLHGDVTFTPTPVAEAPLVDDATRFQVATDGDQIGNFQLIVKYSLPLPKWDRQKPLPLTIPLVVPANEPHQQLGGQQIEFVTSEALSVKPDPAQGDEFSRPTPTSTGSQQAYAWSRVAPNSRWILEPAAGSFSPSVALEKMWLQTWWTSDSRQERAVFRLTTDADQLRLKLPARPRAETVHAAVNGQAVKTAVQPPGTVLIPVPSAGRGRQCTVELWYAMDASISASGWTRSEWRPPAIESATAPRRLYWLFAVPSDQFLVAPPADLTSEMEWQGKGWPVWSRPVRSQEELESWIGASRQEPLPQGANQYLFSSVGSIPALSISIASRRLILAVGGGAALMIGLALLHVRVLRRPEAVLAMAVILAVLAPAFPDVAVLAAQAAGLGLVVALAIAIWSWFTSGRATWTTDSTSARISPAEPRSTDAREHPSERLAGLTTATVSAGSGVVQPSP